MLKKALLIAIGLVLLALPLAIRWLYFHEGQYLAGPISRPDLSQIKAMTPDLASFTDMRTISEPGVILVDLAHDNRVEMAELNVLQARLAARGQRLDSTIASEGSSDLAQKLRYAKALLVISPGIGWTSAEIQQVQDFVAKGGRLLLVADPTRFDVIIDEEGGLAGLDSDVIHINDLAARFGLVFQSDYLYNTVENEGNFRNIRLTEFADHELTQGLDQVVFYAVHSIDSVEPALISVSGETRSSNTERTGKLTVATLAAGEKVLAVGDLTFMTEPYNDAHDNDQFIANVADFLSGAQRQYDLADFPFFFDNQTHLVFAGDPLLDSESLSSGSALQSLFRTSGKELIIRESEDEETDTLFLGLYGDADEVKPYLAKAQVTLLVTETDAVDLGEAPRASPAPLSTVDPLTRTRAVTWTLEITMTPPVVLPSVAGVTVTRQLSSTTGSRLEVGSMGEFSSSGTSLFLVQDEGHRHVMTVLAETDRGLKDAVSRLTKGDLKDCLLHRIEEPQPAWLTLCPAGEEDPWNGEAGGQEAKPESRVPSPAPPEIEPVEPVTHTLVPAEPEGGSEGSILIVSLDDGQGRYEGRTGAEDYAAILQNRYDVAIWSKSEDPPLDTSKLPEYDLIIWTGGDFEGALGKAERELLFLMVLNGTPVLVSGAYVGEGAEQSVQRDVQIKSANHPLAQGFQPGEVISFVSQLSAMDYEIDLQDDSEGMDGEVVFVRGPDSEDAGSSSIWVVQDGATDVQIVFIGFPIYLLPKEVRSQLVLNAVTWMLSS